MLFRSESRTVHDKALGDPLGAEAAEVRGAGAEAIMRKWLRRIRGALGMGFTWAAAWFALGFVPRWVFGVYTDLPLPLLFGGLGFIAGVTFSGLLVLTGGRRRLDQLSLPRLARSEERRVGEECRSRWSPDHLKK